VDIDFDIEDTPLQIQADAEFTGSDNLVRVKFKKESGAKAGEVSLQFRPRPPVIEAANLSG